MILIWGFRTYLSVVAMATVVCGRCHNPAAHRLHRIRRKFTLFFIPLFPVSTKYRLDCTFCGAATRLDQQQADAFIAQAQQQPAYGQQVPDGQSQPAQQVQQPAPQQVEAPQAQPGYGQGYPPPPPYQG